MRDWTDSQRRAITVRGSNLLVSAGAGSGKTAVMIERICSLLREGADIREMAVCTFTKTAAADMKRKLSEAISECIELTRDKHLSAQLSRLGLAQISTLHSLCARIIKTHFFACGADPEFTVLEEGEEKVLKSEAAEEVLLREKENGGKEFAGLYSVFLSNRSHKQLKKAMLAVYEYSRAQADPEGWLELSAKRTDSEYRGLLYGYVKKEAEKLMLRADELLADLAAAGFAKDYEALENLRSCMESEVACTLSTPQLRNKPELEELHDRFKQLKADYAAIAERRAQIAAMPSHEGCGDFEDTATYCRCLASLVRKLGEKYAEYKRERGKLDYSDLEHLTLDILSGTNEQGMPYADEVLKDYKYVFVDEYQDISPLQEEILCKFKCEMFFVGDVKQSIYGFRMCRPTFFVNKRDRYAAGAGETVNLTANFRSGAEILDTVNDVFSRIMTRDFGDTDYSAERLTAGKDIPASVKSVLIDPPEESEEMPAVIYSVQNDNGMRAGKGVEEEVDAVVSEIVNLLDDEREDIKYEDIAVIVRSRGTFTDMLESKLRAESIPVTFVSSDASADTFPSVATLISMLRVIDNAQDDINVAAVLLSPMFGNLTPDELGEIRSAHPGAFCDCLENVARLECPDGTKAKLATFAEKLAGLRRDAACMTVAGLAGKITAGFDCFASALMLGGEREASALDAYLEHLAAQTDTDTLHDYIRRINLTGTPRLNVSGGGKAVKILTIHASKGLEFKCVILPNLSKRFNVSDVYANVICDESEGIVLRSYDFAGRAVERNPRYEVCSAALKRTLMAEELRMLYVAMTRAQNKLILISRRPGSERAADNTVSYADWLYPYPLAAEGICVPAARTEESRKEASVPRTPDKALSDALKNNFVFEYPHERGNIVKASVSGVVHSYDDENPPPAIFSSDDRAAERGSAYHKFMQWANFGVGGEWERLSVQFPAESGLIDRGLIELAFCRVHEFIGGREFAREKPFVYNAPLSSAGGKGNGTVLVQGVIDLMVFDGDDVILVDYKTGNADNIRQNKAYARQLGLYKEAVENILDRKVSGTYLYAFSSGEFIKI